MTVQLLLLFSPLLVFCSTQDIPYEERWWTHPLENFGFRPSPYMQHPWIWPQVMKRPDRESEDFNRFTLKKFRPTKRFDEAQIQEALASDDETGSRLEEEVERLRQLLAEDFKLQARLKRNFKLQARLKRTEMENLSGAGKEYITRLGKRSWTFHRWANGWQPLKTSKISNGGLCLDNRSCNEEQMMKKADRI